MKDCVLVTGGFVGLNFEKISENRISSSGRRCDDFAMNCITMTYPPLTISSLPLAMRFFAAFRLSVFNVSHHILKYEVSAQMNVISFHSVKRLNMLFRVELVDIAKYSSTVFNQPENQQ